MQIFILLLDAVKVKSRPLVLFLYGMFVSSLLYFIYNYSLGIFGYGVKLISYTVQGQEMTLWKRSVKRSIFIQILLISLSAIYTVITDAKMRLMAFATGNIYRKTGTTSKLIKHESFRLEK